jgi:hypothetical protein
VNSGCSPIGFVNFVDMRAAIAKDGGAAPSFMMYLRETSTSLFIANDPHSKNPLFLFVFSDSQL